MEKMSLLQKPKRRKGYRAFALRFSKGFKFTPNFRINKSMGTAALNEYLTSAGVTTTAAGPGRVHLVRITASSLYCHVGSRI